LLELVLLIDKKDQFVQEELLLNIDRLYQIPLTMAKNKTSINVQGLPIRLITGDTTNYFSLTDLAKRKSERPDQTISNWLRNRNTIEYLGTWETVHNPDFNPLEFEGFRNRAGLNAFTISPSQWVEKTNALGITVKAGRYGGTYAHQEIALGFCYWLDPIFQVFVNKEFLALKNEQNKRLGLDWNLKRTLSKINYTVHTDAIKEELIPPKMTKGAGIVYASEADVLNVAVFGMTAKTWRSQNKDVKGNIRDHASTEQLLVLSNLEAVNAELIRLKLSQDERAYILNQAAIKQMKSLISSPSLPKLPNKHKEE
jgi:hypothetical protein